MSMGAVGKRAGTGWLLGITRLFHTATQQLGWPAQTSTTSSQSKFQRGLGRGPQDATRGGIRSGQLLRGGQYSAWEREAGRLLAPQEMVKSIWAALTGLECWPRFKNKQTNKNYSIKLERRWGKGHQSLFWREIVGESTIITYYIIVWLFQKRVSKTENLWLVLDVFKKQEKKNI